MSWIQTAITKKKFYPLSPRCEDVDIRDIAYHLAGINRFTGATRYTVAEHSVRVSMAVSDRAAMLGLLHDAAEAYLGDIARPWKSKLFVSEESDFFKDEQVRSLRDAEQCLLEVILDALGVEPDVKLWSEVEFADELLLATEARDLMSPLQPGWGMEGKPTLPSVIKPWSSYEAENMFLNRYLDLQDNMKLNRYLDSKGIP